MCFGYLDIGELEFIWKLGFGYWNLIDGTWIHSHDLGVVDP